MRLAEVPREMIEQLIGGDRNHRRFEKFAADLFSLRDHIDYETTAPTGDSGVDAEGQITLSKGVARVCATVQRRDFRTKGFDDIDKLARLRIATSRLHVCFSADVKKEVLSEVQAHGKFRFPKAIVQAHGLSGMSDLAFRHQKAFTDNYARDLDVHTLSYASRFDPGEDTNQVNLLRLAVTTVFHPDIVKQRKLLIQNLLIIAIADGESHSPDQITSRVAIGLKLNAVPQSSYILEGIQGLQERSLVTWSREGWKLTEGGIRARDILIVEGAKSSLKGRESFEMLLGTVVERMTAAQLTRLWLSIQDRLASLFADNGLRVVDEMQSLAQLGDSTGATEDRPTIIRGAIADLLGDVDAMTLDSAAKQQVAHVLAAMFNDKGSDGYRWVTQLAVKYVVICSLGLDPQIELRIRDQIQNWVVVPDTHVVLSFVCEGDSGHEACAAVLNQIKHLSGKIWSMESVLEESLNHAKIANGAFREWHARTTILQAQHPEVHTSDLIDQGENAFIKGFAFRAGQHIRLADWRRYMSNFLGVDDQDVTLLADLLTDELCAEFKPDSREVREAGRGYAAQLARATHYVNDVNSTARREWDGRLLASCVIRAQLEARDQRLLIVSESEQIRSSLKNGVVAGKRRNIKVVDAASLACTLAVVPGTSVNLESCRFLLFDAKTELPLSLQADRVLAARFSDSARMLRRSGLRAALEAALLRQDDVGA